MRATIVLIGLVLAACAASPIELREQGIKSTAELRLSPREAANCVAKAIENAGNSWTGYHVPSVRDGDAPETVQLAIVGILVADFSPNTNGSNVTIWEAGQVFSSIRDRYTQAIRGC